ncbi:MAG: phosphotransferase, partial [Anaerolineae bacterium]
MQFTNPFTRPGHWFKGSLHIHSTASDGELAPEEVIGWYARRGYHFLALTDHGAWSEGRAVGDGFITISGVELDGIDPQAGLFHLVGLGARRPPDLSAGASTSMQEAVNRLHDAGGLVVMAHPYWSGQMSKDLLPLDGCFALEVYNGGCEVDDAKGFSAAHWDDL